MIPEFWLAGWLMAMIATARLALALWLIRGTFIF